MMTMPAESGLEVSVVRLPKQDEFILFRFDIEKYDLDEVNDIYRNLQEQLPFNKIVSLPLECQITSFDREEILSIIENLKNYITSD